MGSQTSRKDTRALVSLVARYRSPTTFEFVEEPCYDLSVGGMFIRSSSPAAAGTLLKLDCAATEGAERIRGVARVVWIRREDSEHGPRGMGVKFVKLEGHSRRTIDAIVRKLSEAGYVAASMSIPPEAREPAPSTATNESASAPAVQAAAEPSNEPPAKQTPAPPAPVAEAAPAKSQEPSLAARAIDTDGVVSQVREIDATKDEGARDVARAEIVRGSLPPDAAGPKSFDAAPGTSPSKRPPSEARKVWIWSAVGALVFLAIISSEWFLGEGNDDEAGRPLPPMATEDEGPTKKAPLPAEAPAEAHGSAAAAPEPAAEPTPQVAAPVEPAAAVAAPEPTPEPTPAPAPEASPAATGGSTAREYVVEIVSSPAGATLLIGEQMHVAPARVSLGAFPARVKVTASKPGFQRLAIWIERSGFHETDGVQLRRMYLTLKPAGAGAAVSGNDVTPATPTAETPAPSASAPATTAERPTAEPTPPATGETAMEKATACLAQGDNDCVIAALDGKAKTAREYELLIETLRATGRTQDARRHMATYVERFPDERRAATYKRTLEVQGAPKADESAPDSPAEAPPAPAPN